MCNLCASECFRNYLFSFLFVIILIFCILLFFYFVDGPVGGSLVSARVPSALCEYCLCEVWARMHASVSVWLCVRVVSFIFL